MTNSRRKVNQTFSDIEVSPFETEHPFGIFLNKILCIVSTGFAGFIIGTLLLILLKLEEGTYFYVLIQVITTLIGAFIGYRYNWMIIFYIFH